METVRHMEVRGCIYEDVRRKTDLLGAWGVDAAPAVPPRRLPLPLVLARSVTVTVTVTVMVARRRG